MRGWRSTVVLLVIFAGLVGYVYFVDSKRPTSEDAKFLKEKLFVIAADKVEEVTIKSVSGEEATLKKSNGAWQMVSPTQTSADESQISGITTNLASLEIQRVVEEKPADLKTYGLAPPRMEVGFRLAGEKEFKRFLLGDKTATDSHLYAKVPNSSRVFLLLSYLDTTFNKTPFDLRDKAALKFERDKVDALELTTADHTVQLAKSGGEWRLVKPISARGDFGTVEGVLGRLVSAQMKSIVNANPNPADLKEYGLDRPDATAVVGAGSSRARLELGKRTPDDNVYARDLSRPAVYTVEVGVADEIKKPPSEFRRKDLFEFRPFNATRLEVRRDTETLTFERVKGQGKDAQDKWRRTSSGAPKGTTPSAAADADNTKMETLLTALSNVRAQSFAEPKTNPGLEKPSLRVSVKFDDGKREEGATMARTGSDVFVARADEPGAAQINASDYDEIVKALDALK